MECDGSFINCSRLVFSLPWRICSSIYLDGYIL